MPTMSPEVRAKVPPRTLYIIVYECGSICSCRSRRQAELVRATSDCGCTPGCGARIIPYRRDSLFGRGTDTWHRPSQRHGGADE